MPAGDRVRERRKAAALARHYRDEEGLSIAEIARRLGRAEATVKAYLYDPTGEKARREAPLSGRMPTMRRPHPATQRQRRRLRVLQGVPAGRDRTRVDGLPGARRDARGGTATAASRPPTTGRAPTPAAVAARRWSGWMRATGRRRASSATCTEPGRPRAPPREISDKRSPNRRRGTDAAPPELRSRGAAAPVALVVFALAPRKPVPVSAWARAPLAPRRLGSPLPSSCASSPRESSAPRPSGRRELARCAPFADSRTRVKGCRLAFCNRQPRRAWARCTSAAREDVLRRARCRFTPIASV